MCNGQITEAVFTSGFKTAALTPDQLLLVLAPAMEEIEPLAEPLGLTDLGKVVTALGTISGAANEKRLVHLRVEAHRLVVDEETRGILRLLTAAPKTIGTAVSEDTVAKLLAVVPAEKATTIPLSRTLVEGVKATFSLFKASEVELFVGPMGGKIQVGGEHADLAEFPAGELQADTAYSLLFGKHLIDVLSGVTDYSSATMQLFGPDSRYLLVTDGGYRYLLSRRVKEA